MKIVIHTYDPSWPAQFEAIKAHIEELLCSNNVIYHSIEHVGSTSIPGMSAKPIIDLDIIIDDCHMVAATAALQSDGTYTHLGELGFPQRHHFKYRGESTVPRNLYLCVSGCQALRNHLAVRDLCRSNDSIREKYAKVKVSLGERDDWKDPLKYTEAKNDVLLWILAQSGWSEKERREVELLNTVQPVKQAARTI